MGIQSSGQVGPQTVADGVAAILRQGKSGEQVFTELHGQFYEQVYRGNVYSAGSGVTALSANTVTLTTTSTPIVGVYNPITSTVNLVILQIALSVYANTLTTPVGPGALVVASSVGNLAVSTGVAPLNRKTLTASGSQAKAFNGGVALTGLTNNVVIFDGLEIPTVGPMTFSTITTPVLFGAGIVNYNGSLIIPPGGVLSSPEHHLHHHVLRSEPLALGRSCTMSIISDVFAGGAEGILKGVKGLIETVKADPLELAKLQVETAKAEATLIVALSQAQTRINEIEAGSSDKFTSRWRPAIGWICASAYAYEFVIQPIASFGLAAAGVPVDQAKLPVIDMGELSMVMLGMLGLGAMRSWDKMQGTSK